jgi:hypothetical protein
MAAAVQYETFMMLQGSLDGEKRQATSVTRSQQVVNKQVCRSSEQVNNLAFGRKTRPSPVAVPSMRGRDVDGTAKSQKLS